MKDKSQDTFSNNSLLSEQAREIAAQNKDLKVFRSLYSKKYSPIKNVNTQNFWDIHFLSKQSLNDQDLMTKEKLDTLYSFLPSNKVKILDLGFGLGYFEELLFKRDDSLYGVDISLSAVRKASNRFEGNFKKGDVLDVKKIFSKQKFNVIIAIELIEHISPQKILGFFSDIHSLLEPGGILLVSTPINEHLELLNDNPSGHVRAYTPNILKMELETCGFKLEKIKTLYAFRTHYRLKKFLAKIFRSHWEANNLIVKVVKV